MSDDPAAGKARLPILPRPELGLRRVVRDWRAMFSTKTLRTDIVAGLLTAAVAIPISLAIGIASEVPTSIALVTAVVASLVVPLFGGAPLQITGPAAALTVLVGTIVEAHGLSGLVLVGLLAGVLQLVVGALGLGRFVRIVPASIVHGFTAGIGIIILLQQLPRTLGFPMPTEGHVLRVLLTLPRLVVNADPWAFGLAAIAFALTLFLPRRVPRIPAPLLAVVVCTAISFWLDVGGATLGAMPIGLPMPSLPVVPDTGLLSILGHALLVFTIASATTLVSASAVDRLARADKRHDPDQELVGQGLGNIAVSLFGGIPVSGVVGRSSTNVIAGARTRLAALVHALPILAAVYALPEQMAQIPLAAIAGMLVAIGVQMASINTARALIGVSKADGVVYFATLVAIVLLDLFAGVQVGILVAVLVATFRVAQTHVALDTPPGEPVRLSFRGPLTFLASIRVERMLDRLLDTDLSPGLVIDLRHVREIDGSGAEAVHRIVADSQKRGARVALLGASPNVRDTLLAASSDDIVMPGLAATVRDIGEIIPTASSRAHLAQGVRWLHRVHREELGHVFDRFAEGQQPHTMFITCADSRVSPAMMTGSDPGELFVTRNIGALMPPADLDHMRSEIAAVEYAVRVLGIRSIVVCGHSNCGAMGVLAGEHAAPTEGPLQAWYVAAQQCVGSLASAPDRDSAARLAVRRQLDNLRTHDFVRELEAKGELQLHGWFYDVAAPEVYEWSEARDSFVPIVDAAS